MKLYKALKMKKRLKGDLSDLQHRLQRCVCTIEGNEFDENFSELLLEYNQKKTALVKLKVQIIKANVADCDQYERILRLGELKDLIALYASLSIKSGIQESRGYGSTSITKFMTQLTEVDKNTEIKRLGEELVKITDIMDNFNAETDLPK